MIWLALACGAFVAKTETATFNDAIQFAVLREGTTTFVTVRNTYRGPSEEFAILVPVPSLLGPDDVKTLHPSVFESLESITAPELRYETERDPCWKPDRSGDSAASGSGGGGGGGRGSVHVDASFAVGEYDVVVLSAREAAGLDAWLAKHDYKMPKGLAPLLEPYVAAGSKFFVAKVDPARVTMTDGRAVLSPLRFRYDAPDLTIPLRLATVNSAGEQDVIVYTMAKTAMEAANRPNVDIPRNIVLSETGRGNFKDFYRALFARTVGAKPDAVVTEYVGSIIYSTYGLAPALGGGANSHWKLSRLHLRVTKGGNVDDLVLRASKHDHFRADYVTRTEWGWGAGCANPVRGVYDPEQGDGAGAATGAREPEATTGEPPPLEDLIKTPIDALGVKPSGKRPAPPPPPPSPPSSSPPGTWQLDDPPKSKGGGCGCGAASAGGAGALAMIVLALCNLRRRRDLSVHDDR